MSDIKDILDKSKLVRDKHIDELKEVEYVEEEETVDNIKYPAPRTDVTYVYNMSIIHVGDVSPVIITSTLENAKNYVRRVNTIYNSTVMDEVLAMPYSDEMWIRSSETMWVFVLGPKTEYRILRQILDDDSYLDKQEELLNANKSSSAIV